MVIAITILILEFVFYMFAISFIQRRKSEQSDSLLKVISYTALLLRSFVASILIAIVVYWLLGVFIFHLSGIARLFLFLVCNVLAVICSVYISRSIDKSSSGHDFGPIFLLVSCSIMLLTTFWVSGYIALNAFNLEIGPEVCNALSCGTASTVTTGESSTSIESSGVSPYVDKALKNLADHSDSILIAVCGGQGVVMGLASLIINYRNNKK